MEEADGDGMLFLAERRHKDCPYRGVFAGLQVCRCPARFELFTWTGR